MANSSDIGDVASGLAALSICESLLLAMGDLRIMNEEEAVGVIEDAAAGHRNYDGPDTDSGLHVEVVAILDRIIAGGNSIRHPCSSEG
jgi:hypothetical protein